MILVIITALAAVCCADKLDKTYLPPLSAKTAGGNAGFLQTPFARSLEQGPKALPAGGFTNDFQGVVVDAANPGSRASGLEGSGLGGPRSAYGSFDSKVGDAAFTVQSDDVVSSRIAPGFDSLVYGTEEKKPGQNGEASLRLAPGFNYEGSDEDQDFKSQVNSLKFNSDVRLNNYNYGFETENGIAAGQTGEAAGGVKAQGGYEYKGNDGQQYKVTYTADKDGFKPQGSHLPTPPPVPQEILVSLEQNAKDEAAGVVDDGSYDAHKYNDEGVYSGQDSQDKQNVQAFAGDSGSGSFSSQNQGSQFGSGAFNSFGNQQSTQFGGFKATGLKPVSKTENRFGSEQTEGSNAFSTAFTSGSGIATAFAQAGSAPTDKGTNVAPSAALAYGSGNQDDGQSVATADSQPGLSTSFASVQGLSGSASSFASNAGLQNQDSSATASASVTPQPEYGFGIKSEQFGNYPESQFNRPGFPSFPIKPGQNAFGSTFGGANYQLNKPGQFGFLSQQNKFGIYSTGSLASAAKPSINQPQRPDSSYYYKQPSKPFSTPVSPVSSTFSSSNSSPPKFPNTFISPTTVTQTTSSTYNGITQANISSFPSGSPTAPTQFGSQSSQFGLKPTSSSDSSLSSEKYSQTTTFNKPLIQTGQNTFAQNTVGSTQAPIQEYQGTIYEYNKPAESLLTPSPGSKKPANSETGSQVTDGSLQSGVQSSSDTAGSLQSVQNSFTAQSTGSQFGQKPSIISGSKFSQSQFGSSQFAQKPFGSSPTSNFNSQPTQLATSSVFNQKPQNTYGASTSFGTQSSQVEQKPTLQQTQFGSLTGSQFNLKPQKGQTTTDGQIPFGSSQKGTTLQVATGSVSQFDKKPSTSEVTSSSAVESQTVQTSQTGLLSQAAVSNSASAQNTKDSSSTSTQKEQTFQFNQKPFESTQGYKQGQFSSSFGSQFGQKPFVTSQTGLYKPQTQFGTFGQKQQSFQFSQKPFGSSLTGSSFQQSQFGSQFNKKPSTNQGSSFSSGTTGQAIHTSQFPVHTQTGSVIQQTQTGSNTGSLFGQKPLNTQSFSSTVETQKKPNTQYVAGSQYEKKPESNQGSSFSSGTYTGSSAVQTTQFSLKPESGESVSQQNQFGSSTDLQSQKPQTGTTFQQNQAGSALGYPFGQKPFGSSQTGSYFQKPSPVFGQQPVASFGSGSQSTQSQFGQKPFGGSYFQHGQFGSQDVQKTQSNKGSSFATTGLSGQKVQTSQLTQQNQVISTTESQFALKPQFTQEQTLQFGQKPFSSSQILNSQSNQYGSSFGQNQPQLSQQKPFGTTSTTFDQTQFSTSVSKFEQKPQNIQESGFTSTSTLTEKDQTIQYGQKPTQKVDSNLQQSQFTTGSEYKQTGFAATSGSQLGQKPQGVQGSGFAFGSQSQFGQNQFGSQNTGFSLPSNQFGATSGSQLSQTSPSKVQTVENSHTDNKPSGSQLTQGSSFSSSQSQNFLPTQKPFGTQNLGSNYQQSQFGSSTFSTTTTSKTPFAQQPFGSQTTGSGTQQSQLGSAFTSQFPYTTSKPQFSYKPFGNTQGSYEQTQFTGSYFAKKPETAAQSSGSAFGTQTSQGSTFGSQTQKEFGSHTNLQQNQFGLSSQFNQPQLSQASAFASNSGFYKPQLNSQYKPFTSSFNNQGSKFSFSPLKPFNTQTTFGSQAQQSQFGSNEQKPSLTFSGSGSQSEVGQSDEKTQLSQGGLQNAGASAQATSSSVGFTGKPQNVYGGYSYQKPQTSFGVTPRPDQNQQPTQATAFASSSPAPFGVSTTESSNFKESQTVSQFGSQSGVGTNGNNYGSTSRPQFSAFPVSGTTGSYVQPTQAPLFGGQTYKPFGVSQGNFQKPIGSSTFGFQTQGSQVAGQGTKNQFGQVKPVSTTVAPGFQGSVDTSTDDVEGRPKEEFGGPRDPPKFDDKTGYHY